MQELQQRALYFIKMNGPVIPVQLSKNLKIDLMLAGALLSELLATRDVSITTAKIGTSPLYFTKGQDSKLQILREHLSDIPKKSYDLLKDAQVLKDEDCTPWQRIAYRELKDFAKPLEYTGVLYWRWYLASEEQILEKLKRPALIPELVKTEPTKLESPALIPELVKTEPTKEQINQQRDEPITEKHKIKPPQENHKEIVNSKKNNIPASILTFFDKHEIDVNETTVIKKFTDIEFKINLPSVIGKVKYLAIFLAKKKLSEGDLSITHSRGQRQNSPVLLLSNGELTKKAQKFLKENYNGSIIFKHV